MANGLLRGDGKAVLLQGCSNFFAVQPFLKALKTCQFPLNLADLLAAVPRYPYAKGEGGPF